MCDASIDILDWTRFVAVITMEPEGCEISQHEPSVSNNPYQDQHLDPPTARKKDRYISET